MTKSPKIILPASLLKIVQVATGQVGYRQLSEDEVITAAQSLARIADIDSRESLIKILPDSSRAAVEASIQIKREEPVGNEVFGGMSTLQDSMTFLGKSSVSGAAGTIKKWLEDQSTDHLKRMGFEETDFDVFLKNADGRELDLEAHKERVGIAERYFTLLLDLSLAGIKLDNDIVSNLFQLQFGQRSRSQLHLDKSWKGYDESSPEHIGLVNMAKKVLAAYDK